MHYTVVVKNLAKARTPHSEGRLSGLLAFALVFMGLFGAATPAQAQQKIGYIDSEYILELTPEYATIQQNIDRMAQEWQAEVDQKREDAPAAFRRVPGARAALHQRRAAAQAGRDHARRGRGRAAALRLLRPGRTSVQRTVSAYGTVAGAHLGGRRGSSR